MREQGRGERVGDGGVVAQAAAGHLRPLVCRHPSCRRPVPHLCIFPSVPPPGGELLEELEEQGAFSEPQARRIFRQLLLGVQYLHSL